MPRTRWVVALPLSYPKCRVAGHAPDQQQKPEPEAARVVFVPQPVPAGGDQRAEGHQGGETVKGFDLGVGGQAERHVKNTEAKRGGQAEHEEPLDCQLADESGERHQQSRDEQQGESQSQQISGAHQIIIPGRPRGHAHYAADQTIAPERGVEAVGKTVEGAEEGRNQGVPEAAVESAGSEARVLPPG